ncbi:MAG: response regulator [Ferruginibacter sp.]
MNAKHLNILLADDDTDDCIFFKDALEAIPVSTKLNIVNDGEELMNYLHGQTGSLPHILFLDINMPRKNGFECLAEIKSHEKLRHLPVVMFSTSGEQEKINLLFQAGADVYVRKPNSFAQLVQVIQLALPMAAENTKAPLKLKYVLNA